LEKENSRFLITYSNADSSIEFISENHLFVFLTKGAIRITMEEDKPNDVVAPSLFLIPKNNYYKRKTLVPSHIMVFPFNNLFDISGTSIHEIVKSKEKSTIDEHAVKSFSLLKIGPVLLKFLEQTRESYSSGLMDENYFKLKTKELIYIMEKTYNNQERIHLFYPILNKEYVFSNFIYNNYKKVKTVNEFANLSCYSLSGFEKKFRKIFGVAPSKWLKQKLSMRIYHEIVETDKPFKEISLDYGFSSPSHFNNFCKTILKGTPGQLRQRNVHSENSSIAD
jgi:AraC-like DNA-binding protein